MQLKSTSKSRKLMFLQRDINPSNQRNTICNCRPLLTTGKNSLTFFEGIPKFMNDVRVFHLFSIYCKVTWENLFNE
jgi:hypothetical protein